LNYINGRGIGEAFFGSFSIMCRLFWFRRPAENVHSRLIFIGGDF
jgi:hypothetical protein